MQKNMYTSFDISFTHSQLEDFVQTIGYNVNNSNSGIVSGMRKNRFDLHHLFFFRQVVRNKVVSCAIVFGLGRVFLEAHANLVPWLVEQLVHVLE